MKPQQSMFDVLVFIVCNHHLGGGGKETQEPFWRTVNVFMCEFV